MIELDKHLIGVKHVIWDWNGTLLNDLESVIHALASLMGQVNLPPITKEQYLENFGFPVVDFYKKIGFDPEGLDFDQLSEDFHKYYFDFIHKSELFDGAVELLQQVKGQGLKQSILTAAFQNHIDQWIVDYKIDHLFDYVYGLSNKMAHSKVDRGHELMQMVGSKPSETLLIGDTDHDLLVGQELGIKVVLLSEGHQSYGRLKEKHSVVLTRKI